MSQTNVPLEDSAVLSPRILNHLSLKKDGKILVVFPRGTPFAKINAMAEKYSAKIYVCKVRTTYEVLAENYEYDHSPRISL